MPIRRILILLCSVFMFFHSKGYAQDTIGAGSYSLQQCVDIAIKNNPDVKQAAFRMEEGRINRQQAWAGMFPDLSGGISHSIYNGRSINPYTNGYINQQNTTASYQLSAGVILWNGSSVQNYIRQSTLAYEAGKMDWQQAKDEITIQVILDYLAVLNATEQLEMARQQAEVTNQQVERLTKLNSDGAISPDELYKLRGQAGADVLNAVAAANTLEAARLSLAQLMNIPYSADMKLERIGASLTPAIYGPTVDDIYGDALAHLALVKAASFREKSAEKGVKAARGQLLPVLSLSAGIYTNYSSAATLSKLLGTSEVATDQYVLVNNDKKPVYAPQSDYSNEKITYGNQWKNNFNSNVSLNLQIPIFNGLQARSRVRLAKVGEKEAAFELNTTRLRLRQAIERDYLSMTAAYKTYKTLLQQVQDYAESFRAAEIKFGAGAITSVDYVIAKNDLDRARLNLISARYNYILQTKILDYYQGKPLW